MDEEESRDADGSDFFDRLLNLKMKFRPNSPVLEKFPGQAGGVGDSPEENNVDGADNDMFQLIENLPVPAVSPAVVCHPTTSTILHHQSIDPQTPDKDNIIMAGLSGFNAEAAIAVSSTSLTSTGGAKFTSRSLAPIVTWKTDDPFSRVYVKIIEQPAGNKLRFRYECEGRSAGALHGVNSTPENKTYPTIQVVGYKGPAVVVVSCVEEKPPYRPHPHNLVGKDGMCKSGVCSVDINAPDMIVQFQSLGIQCVRRKDACASLQRRERIRVDPFKQGFKLNNSSVNINAVRLCFQVFLKTTEKGLVPLKPVVSNIIHDKKARSDLQIVDCSDYTSPVKGGKKILLFCEKISKDDIEVHFTLYTKSGEQVTCKGEFTPNDVHKQCGIALRTPAYPNQSLSEEVAVSMYLYKPSDQTSSEPVEFWYLPANDCATTCIDCSPSKGSNIKGVQSGGVVQSVAKRGRPPKSQDDPSSGMLNVPPKIPTAQFRGSGGQVTVVNNCGGEQETPVVECDGGRHNVNGTTFLEANTSFLSIMETPYTYGNMYNSTSPVVHASLMSSTHPCHQYGSPTTQGDYTSYTSEQDYSPQSGHYQRNHVQSLPPPPPLPPSPPPPSPPPPPPPPPPPHMLIPSYQPPPQNQLLSHSPPIMTNMINQFLPASSGSDDINFSPHALNTSDVLNDAANLGLATIDVHSGDLENLSSNLNDNLKINKQQRGMNDLSSNDDSSPSCLLSHVRDQDIRRVSSQLHTPDVSLVSVEGEAAGGYKKRHNLSKS